MLNFLLNNPKRGLKVDVKKPEQKGISSPENLYIFSQGKYLSGDLNAVGLDEEGYVYVPKSCVKSNCLVHFNFHGCNQGKGKVHDIYALHNDLNDFAELNNMIIAYPQAHTTSRFVHFFIIITFGLFVNNLYFHFSNPQGCWDWWGYSGSNYALKQGFVSFLLCSFVFLPLIHTFLLFFIKKKHVPIISVKIIIKQCSNDGSQKHDE